MFILDTNVVSELRKIRSGQADEQVILWSRSVDADLLYVSVVTILEIEIGVLQKEAKDPRQGAMLRRWMDETVLPEFEDRTLPIDIRIALRSAALRQRAQCPERDALIAATALVHGMTVVTRNTRDFETAGVAMLNPWLFADR